MKPFMYALSTCPYCKGAKKFLEENGVEFDFVDVDLLVGDEQQEVVDKVREVSGGTSFPVLVVGDEHVVGFDREKIALLVGIE